MPEVAGRPGRTRKDEHLTKAGSNWNAKAKAVQNGARDVAFTVAARPMTAGSSTRPAHQRQIVLPIFEAVRWRTQTQDKRSGVVYRADSKRNTQKIDVNDSVPKTLFELW